MKIRVYISVALVSAALIGFQLALIQVLSIVQWYHFAYMVIAMAMLGFGAAGSFLSLFRQKLLGHADRLIPFLLTVTGLAMALVIPAAQLSYIRFDAYLLFADYGQIWKLIFTYGLFFIPFFSGALMIGLVFIQQVERIGKIYFANLLGSGIGGILGMLLATWFFPGHVSVFIATLPVIAGLFLLPPGRPYPQLFFSTVVLIVIAFRMSYPAKLKLSEYKDLSKALLLPGAQVISSKPGPHGVVQVVSSPVLRYAPGLSLLAQDAEPVKTATFLNGNWFGAVTGWGAGDSVMILDYTTAALPYIMAKREKVLVLEAGTGMEVVHALSRGAHEITAVEANPVILSALKHRFAGPIEPGADYAPPAFRQLEPRSFLTRDTAGYDLVVLPIIGTFGGSVGMAALQEQFVLTREAVTAMWQRLNPGGVICFTAWMDYPVRNPLKILATIVEVLQQRGIDDPAKYIAAIRSWGTISFVLTKNALSASEINNIRGFCDSMLFDPTLLPGLTQQERTTYNQFQDQLFFSYVDSIFSPGRNLFYKDYDFNIRPATDNKPYFSQFIKWGHFFRLADFFGNRSIPFFGTGYLLVIVTFLQVLLASIILIVLPLIKIGFKGKGKAGILFYFAGIGLGYMFVEMVLIQHFILYLGNPVYAASAVITSLLVFSGVGSFYSGSIARNKKWMNRVWIFTILVLVMYAFGLSFLLQQTVHWSPWLRWLTVLAVIGPPAFCMGIPFPFGLSYVSQTSPSMLPWAWGINGCVSVISTVLATILAVEAGFTAVMLGAVCGYCVAFVSLIMRK